MCVIGVRGTKKIPDDLPVFSRRAWRWNCGTTELRTTFSVDPCSGLLRIRRARQANVCELGTKVTMVSLVHDESILGNRLRVDLVGVQEVDELGLRCGGLLRWDEANLVGGGS